jgi:hypothetical protein
MSCDEKTARKARARRPDIAASEDSLDVGMIGPLGVAAMSTITPWLTL